MSLPILHILHLPSNTPDSKVNEVLKTRKCALLKELEEQGITDYSLIDGFYEPYNTKLAIHKGHRRIVELAKAQRLPHCVIGEDDLKFTSPKSYEYFISQIPASYDLFFALIYSGTIENNRVMNGFSGGMTLYSIHSRYYEEFLNLPLDTHVDRECGLNCYNHEFYVVPEYCVTQRGGYSMNLRQSMTYEVYLQGKKLYGVD